MNFVKDTPLMVASFYNHVKIIEYLLKDSLKLLTLGSKNKFGGFRYPTCEYKTNLNIELFGADSKKTRS